MTTWCSLLVAVAVSSVEVVAALPVPGAVRSASVATVGETTVFLQRSDDGLLIATIAVPVEAGARASFNVRQASSRVIFCPTSLLEFATGAPSAACLASANPIVPGPGALVGAGTIRANLRLDGAGRATGSSAARVEATVAGPDGATFALNSSIVFAGDPARPDAAHVVYDRIELALGDVGEEAEAPAEPGIGRAERLERLLELTEEEWQAVELLMALTPRDAQLFEAVLNESAGAGTGPVTDAVVAPLGLIDTINTILARVNAIRTNVEGLIGRIPDRPDVRGLIGQVSVGNVRDVLAEVRDTLQGLVDVAQELRAGFDTFDAAQFRARLGGVLDDFESASTLYQRLLCMDNPELTIRPVPTTLVRRLIDHTPGVALYGLSRVLEALDPEWDVRIGSVVDQVPAELTELCGQSASLRAVNRFDAENLVCKVLRKKPVGTALRVVKTLDAAALLVFRFAKNHTKEEITVTAGANVVAGATAGTSVKNPVYATVSQWVDRLENIKDGLSDALDRRQDCLDADSDIEDDLADCAKDGCACAVPLSVVLQGVTPPTYTYVADLVLVRIDQAEDAGLPNVEAARLKHTDAVDTNSDETAAGYGLLCEAYKLLLPNTGITPPAGGIEPPPMQRPRPRSMRR